VYICICDLKPIVNEIDVYRDVDQEHTDYLSVLEPCAVEGVLPLSHVYLKGSYESVLIFRLGEQCSLTEVLQAMQTAARVHIPIPHSKTMPKL
jgi:hypothetical protein